MELEGGGWQEYVEVGPNYKEGSSFRSFKLPSWYELQAFNEYLVIMRSSHRSFWGGYQEENWEQTGWNLWFNYFIIGQEAY